MISLEYDELSQRLRLKDRAHATGRVGKRNWEVIVVTLVCFVVGLVILTIAAGWFDNGPHDDQESWTWACFGVISLAVGLGFGIQVIWLRQEEKRRLGVLSTHSHADALLDRAWHPEYSEVGRWSGLWTPLSVAVGLTVFLVPFNYFAILEGNWRAIIAVGIFDAAALYVWWITGVKFCHSLHYGDSRVIFPSFPIAKQEKISLLWRPPTGLGLVNQGSYILRCIEQWNEVTKDSSGEESHRLITEQLWAGTWSHDLPQNYRLVPQVELLFAIDTSLPCTDLRRSPSHFWELEVKLKCEGPDFEAIYLIPVYGDVEDVSTAA